MFRLLVCPHLPKFSWRGREDWTEHSSKKGHQMEAGGVVAVHETDETLTGRKQGTRWELRFQRCSRLHTGTGL